MLCRRPVLAEAGTGVHTLSLAGLNITTGGSQQEALPGAEKARKEIARKKSKPSPAPGSV